jgi:hypothetical protein
MPDFTITTEKLKSDFDAFEKKLNLIPANLKPKYETMQNRLKGDLSLAEIQKDENTIDEKTKEFYLLFGEFTEDSNTVKMLYQVLLEEYFHLGIFNAAEHLELKQTASYKIATHIMSGSWSGENKNAIRAKYRFEMLELIRLKVHEKSAQRSEIGDPIAAVCFSGGGIRSATFGLGVLQGLARHNLLSKFEYISTVSGGGYIGSWLSAWIHRINNEKDECLSAQPFTNDDAKSVEKRLVMQTAEVPEAPEITHLRSYSNYMSPRTGLFSTDTWTLVAVYIRNLLLNWTVFVPLIAAFLLIPKILATVFGVTPHLEWQFYLLVVALFFGIGGVLNINAMRPSFERYSWVDQHYKVDDVGIYKSVEGKIFRWVLLWILILSFSMTIFWAWTRGNFRFPFTQWFADRLGTDNLELLDYILFSVILFLGGYLLAWIFMLPSYIKVKNEEKKEAQKRKEAIAGRSLWQTIKYYYTTYFAETLTSLICGVAGGALLYLLVSNLTRLSSWFSPIFQPDLNLNKQLEIQTVSAQLVQQKDESLFAYVVSLLTTPSAAVPAPPVVTPEFLVCFGVPLFLLVFLLSSTLFVGLAVRFTSDEDREWLSRLGALILMSIIGWSVISAAVIFGPYLFTLDWKGSLFTAVGGVSGLITLILGFSSKSTGKVEGSEPKSKTSFLMWFAPAIAAPIFVLFLVVLISYATTALIEYAEDVEFITSFRHLAWFIIFGLIGVVMGFFININKFSIHSIYRERLIRAYLGASRTKKRLYSANSFTGLDSEKDNVEMRCLRQKPFHVVNMTLNIVKTHNLRWQNRKAESFTATALYCGSSNMGEGSGNYRTSDEYGLNAQSGRAITLGTAAAISGAAASPNMGYYTMSAAVSFLMVLFNVRLGWWLGNPGKRGALTYNLPAPRWSPRLFLDESVGGTDDSKPYVYLSDGGHFDNLGLYEMVLRRCRLIVVSDAACDADFEFSDFGTSIHKIRVDMGIPIVFDSDKHPAKNRNCGIGRIKYSCVDGNDEKDDGILIYIKPTLDGDEPIDLKNYKKENPNFPHESTADQMYSETQFESYRSLGFHQMNTICCRLEKCSCRQLSDFAANAQKYLDLMENKE